MNEATLSYLACCSCRSGLRREPQRLRCSECGLTFPIVQGRPVIMSAEMVMKWKSPVDEALGFRDAGTLMDSVRTLAELGVEGALEMLHNVPSADEKHSSIETVSASDRGKMRYRGTGEWFRYRGRERNLLVFPWEGDSDGSFRAFMRAVMEDSPETVLDLASGGGFGVSQQAFLNTTAECILAVERDLKCLTNIQYRFKHIGKDHIADAVGGDVRHLPVRDASFDTAMMLAALPEIHGISRMLREVFRVLKPGGSFHLLLQEDTFVGKEPFASMGLSEADFSVFARAADLFAGGESFIATARSRGFDVVSGIFGSSKGGKRRLLRLIKGS